jgi:MFS family permease
MASPFGTYRAFDVCVQTLSGGIANATAEPQVSKRSLFGLNAANFFQAEMVGVVLPVLNVFLRETHWRYDQIGIATAVAGLGTLIFQTPAGVIIDRVASRRFLFAATAILTGICFAVLPLTCGSHLGIDSLLFLSGVAQTFFPPLLGALALALVGFGRLNRTMGVNQGWNHAGNIAAALGAMFLVAAMGTKAIFYAVGISSALAAASVLLIRRGDLNERLATGLTHDAQQAVSWTALLRDRIVLFLFISIFLFHFANAPILPAVALYVKHLGGSDGLSTATVLTAQIVMVPTSLLTGRLCDAWGRKLVMGIAFWVLPLRILSYAFVRTATAVVWLQSLDGIGAGIYGVAVVVLCADLSRGRGRFNTLMGLFATALAIGGVVGPVVTGILVQQFGFRLTFFLFAALAGIGAIIFTLFVPETKPVPSSHERELVAA